MADYKVALTSAGASLMAKCLTGKKLNFVSVKMGDGDMTGSFGDAVALISVKKTLPISAIVRTEAKVNVKAMLDYTSITEDFQWKEVGLFASDPDTGAEVLYCYGNAGNKGDWITKGTSATAKSINLTALVSNVPNVTAIIDNAAIYAVPDLSNVSETAVAAKIRDAAYGGILTPEMIGAISADEIGQSGGVAGLGLDGKVSAAQMPTMDYVPTRRKINGKVLTDDIVLSAADVGAELSGAVTSHNISADAHTVRFNAKADLVGGKVPIGQIPDLNQYATKSELNEVKTSVGEGKALIAAAVTGKGVPTAADVTFQTLVNNIRALDVVNAVRSIYRGEYSGRSIDNGFPEGDMFYTFPKNSRFDDYGTYDAMPRIHRIDFNKFHAIYVYITYGGVDNQGNGSGSGTAQFLAANIGPTVDGVNDVFLTRRYYSGSKIKTDVSIGYGSMWGGDSTSDCEVNFQPDHITIRCGKVTSSKTFKYTVQIIII